MTGYGRGDCSQDGFKITVELSSVNRKQSEISVNLPREMEMLERYMPPELPEGELESGLREIVAATGAQSKKDMGKVMKEATARYKGRVDGKKIQEIVARLLP